jgi:hypothetical protein
LTRHIKYSTIYKNIFNYLLYNMRKIAYLKNRFRIICTLLGILFMLSIPAFASAASFIVDWADWNNSTWPCVWKTVCHISWNLTYSDISLINWAKLSHRQWDLTVVNDFIIWTWWSSYFVWQDLSVWHQLKVTNASIVALNSDLTSEPVSTDINDWMWSSYYDLSITNTDVNYDWLDINLTTWGYVKTRNAVINSRFKYLSNSTSPVWTTYANWYISIDWDANITNVKMDIDGYIYVWWNLTTDYTWAAWYYMYIRGNSQIATPLSTLFSNWWMSVTWNYTSIWNTTTPTEFHFYTTTWWEW